MHETITEEILQTLDHIEGMNKNTGVFARAYRTLHGVVLTGQLAYGVNPEVEAGGSTRWCCRPRSRRFADAVGLKTIAH